MEALPLRFQNEKEFSKLKKKISKIKNLKAISDIHLWCLSSENEVLACKVVVKTGYCSEVKENIKRIFVNREKMAFFIDTFEEETQVNLA